MSHTPHEIAEDFPEHVEAISKLRVTNGHFSNLMEAYHEINRDVHRAETDIEPTSDAHLSEMRRKRMTLKDEIYAMLKEN
jgi:uncharacterized protein YdcH (DUF465 family)